MGTDSGTVDKGMVRPRAEVLRSGLRRLAGGDPDGAGTVRRMARVIVPWAREARLEQVEDAAFQVEVSPDSGLVEAGGTLLATLEGLLDEGEGQTAARRHVVLAVEDEPTDAALLEAALQTPDRTLFLVSSVADAEVILNREEVELLILDLGLPDADGRGLLLQLREQGSYKDLPILVLSAKVGPEAKTECLALGANAFFEKPVDPPQLAAAVGSYLERETERKLGARRDPLTGLMNRTHFRELWKESPFPDPTAVALLGLDRFRTIRDRFGEGTSDAVVKSVATLLEEFLPRTSICSRWGAAEFLILVPGIDRPGTVALLENALAKLRAKEHLDPTGETFRVTASGGVVALKPGSSLDTTIADAEARLAWAAGTGGNTLAENPGPLGALTVLLAEDDLLSAGILQHRLEKDGFKVLHYPDGIQALDGAMAHRISMAILDVKMPGMDGFELLERLRKVPAYQDLPIMMLTSLGREEDVVRGLSLGADDYMLKPFSPVEVVARARRLLKR